MALDTVSADPSDVGAQGPPPTRRRRVVWWREVGLGVLFYLLYAQVRDLHGDSLNAQSTRIARRHGRDILDFEKALHLDFERGLQHALLAHKLLVKILGGYYGSAHFVVTIGILIWLLVKRPDSYRFWRSVLALTTVIAVVIFALYPVMPPRLLPPSEGTVDTLSRIGGLWSYNHGVLEHISDPYAAMPSLHLGWSTWCAAALWSALPARSRRAKILIIGYPTLTYFTVVLTGTHYVIDGVAGMATMAVAYLLVRAVTRRRARRADPAPPPETVAVTTDRETMTS